MIKDKKLEEYMLSCTRDHVVVAFSGGADSSLVLKLAVMAAAKNGRNVYGIYIHTNLHPAGEAKLARKVCEEIGAIYEEVEVDEFSKAGIQDNPVDRCYRCKQYMFRILLDKARGLGVATVMDGTNADDLHVYRPGVKALKELGIKSPLAECGYTKEDVRRLLGEYGISVSNRPAAPCLATRFPYGTHLTQDMLTKVDKAEEYIRQLGCKNVRVRIHGDIVRIEVDVCEEKKLLEHRKQLIDYIKELGYHYITLDLEGFRSGSMDVTIKE